MTTTRPFSLGFIWFLSSFIFFCLPCNGIPQVNLDEALPNAQVSSFFTPGCPVEHYKGIEAVKLEPLDHSYKFRDKISFRCKFDNDQYHQDQYIVFPSNKRTCQSNGTWSGVPPVCVRTTQNFQTNADAIPLQIKQCTAGACTYERNNWPAVGLLDSKCSWNKQKFHVSRDMNGTRVVEMLTLFTFPRHFYFNFMTFSLPRIENGEPRAYHVEIQAPSEDMIQDFSMEASDFLEKQYEGMLKSKDFLSLNKCAVIRIGTYSRQLLVRFTLTTALETFKWAPLPKFYSVPEVDQSGRVSPFWDEGPGCTSPPTIPNTVRRDLGNSTYDFDCLPGGVLWNPKANERNNRISCHRGYEWEPYPFPVCLYYDIDLASQFIKPKSKASKKSAQEEETNGSKLSSKSDENLKLTANYASLQNHPTSAVERATSFKHLARTPELPNSNDEGHPDSSYAWKYFSITLILSSMIGFTCTVMVVLAWILVRNRASRNFRKSTDSSVLS